VGEDAKWSERMGINGRTPEAIPFHLLPSVKYQFQNLREKIRYL
jgi:hypothetical protein